MSTTRATASADTRLRAYLQEIAARLNGPRRRQERILAELHDGLEQAVADRAEAGLPEDRAVIAAIEEFGSPRTVADAFAPELATAYARRTIAWFIATGPAVGVWWLLLLQPHPWRTGLVALLAAIPIIPLVAVAIATATGALATTGRLMRWLPESSPNAVLAAAIAVAALALAGDTIIIGAYARSDLPLRLLAVLAIAASLTRIVCSLLTIRHAVAWRTRLTLATNRTTTLRDYDARR